MIFIVKAREAHLIEPIKAWARNNGFTSLLKEDEARDPSRQTTATSRQGLNPALRPTPYALGSYAYHSTSMSGDFNERFSAQKIVEQSAFNPI